MTPPTASRGALVGLLVAALLAAGVAGVVAPAGAQGNGSVDDVAVDDDEGMLGTTEVHAVSVTASGVNTSGGSATLVLDLSDWDDGAVGPVSASDVNVSGDAALDGDPSVDGNAVTVPLSGTDSDDDRFAVAVDVELTHPSTAPDSPYAVAATVSDGDGTQVAGPAAHDVGFVAEDLSASTADGTVDSTGDGAETTLTVGSNREGTLDARVTAQGLDGDDLYALFEGDEHGAVERDDGAVLLRDLDPGASVPMDFAAVHPASYEFTVTATDTGASDTAAVTVEEREMDASFGKTVYEADTGDLVSFGASFSGTSDGYVVVGGDRVGPDGPLTNFIDVLYVGGGSTVTVNTRLLGSDAPADQVYLGGTVVSYRHSPDDPAFDDLNFTDADGDEVASDLESFRREVGIGEPSRPLGEGRYRLLAGTGDVVVREDGVPDFERPLARSNLFLTEPTYGNMTTYVAPRGKASATESPGELRGSLTQRTTVTKGDRLVFEFDATGFHGTLSWVGEGPDPLSGGGSMHPTVLAELLDLPAGFTIEAVQRAPERNEDRTELDLAGASDGEAYFLAEDARGGGDDVGSTDTYYLVVDTRGTGPFDGVPEPGETYDVEVGFRASSKGHYRFDRVDHAAKTASDDAVDHYPYLEPGGESELWTANVTVEAPRLRWNRTDAHGRLIVLNRSDASVAGEINYAPGTELSAQLLPDNRTARRPIDVQSVSTTENGTFEIGHDLSDREPGEALGLEFYVREELFDKRAVAVVESPDAYPRFEVADAPDQLAVTENGSTTVTTDLHNPGRLPGRERVELRVDGEVVDARTLTVGANESASVQFELPAGDREPGSYEYTVVTPQDRLSGQFVVESTEDPGDAPGAPTPADTPSGGGNGTDATPQGTETPGGDQDGDDAGLFGLPIPVGGRHAVGGAVIVGGVYVLDYARASPEPVQQGVATAQALLQKGTATVRALVGDLLD